MPTRLLLKKALRAYATGEIRQAITLYKNIITSDPYNIQALAHLGVALASRNDYAKALPLFQTASLLEGTPTTLIQSGMCLHKLNRNDEALSYFKRALQYAPHSFDANMQASKALTAQQQLEKAEIYAKKAVSLQPDAILGLMNLGTVYNEQGKLNQALSCYKKVLTLQPSCASALYNCGYTLKLAGKMRQALPYLKKALEVRSNHVDTHIALSHAYWSLGDFENAWREYDKRWQRFKKDPRPMSIPLWDGKADLAGKQILLYCEQGMGDTLQFIRFAECIKKRGAYITCKIQKPLQDLLASYPYVDHFVTEWPSHQKLRAFDYQAPLMSMPGLLYMTPETLPQKTPYLFINDALVEKWHKKINSDTKFRVGLCWHVDPIHETEKSPLSKRSLSVDHFAPLNTVPSPRGISFYSLQKINDTQMLETLPADFSFELASFDPHFDKTHGRFMDTAALIKNLDLVITVDTSICHLAAALGKETWVLLPYAPNCRFSVRRTDMPWYPTMRLFRQKQPFDWHAVIDEVRSALTKKCGDKK